MNKTRLENIFAELVVVLLLRNKESIGLVKELYDEILNYKNIEDELGIDLVTLFKALKQGHIWVKKKGKVISSCDYNLGLTGTTYDLYCKDVGEWLLVKDYGKTWALTEEELK